MASPEVCYPLPRGLHPKERSDRAEGRKVPLYA
jgi:hypothetical protein